MATEKFRTRDLSLASAVTLISGIEPVMEADPSGKVQFIFPADDGIRKAVISYHDGAVAPICDFVETFKRTKAAMFNSRGGGR